MQAIVKRLAPHFEGMAFHNNQFTKISLDQFKSKYLVLYFYPLDFTFVCPTEIVNFSKAMDRFKALDCDVVGVSVDSHFVHQKYCQTPLNEGGVGELQYPLLSDLSKSISRDYGVLHDGCFSLRGTFIIDRDQVIRHASVNDAPVGRNVDEIVRLV